MSDQAARRAPPTHENKPWEMRRDSWRASSDRGFAKVPAGIDLAVSQNSDVQRDHGSLLLDVRRELLAKPTPIEQSKVKPKRRR